MIRVAVILAVMAIVVACVTPVAAIPAEKDDFSVVPIIGGPNNATPKWDVPANVSIPEDNPAIWEEDLPSNVFRQDSPPPPPPGG